MTSVEAKAFASHNRTLSRWLTAGGASASNRGIAEFVVIALLLLALTVALQFRAHSYSAEFATDEASHYVSGLLVHDYLRAGLESPTAYLRHFHSHYPLVGIGHWGPCYYVVEAVWMLLFGSSRTSVLLLSATVTTAVSALIYGLCATRCGRAIALLSAVAFVACRITQESSADLMLDIPIALGSLLAMLAYARYLDMRRVGDAVLFAVLASTGMLIKGNAGCLALLPPFALLIGRRFELLRAPTFWLPLPIVAVLTLPWYAPTYSLISVGYRYTWGMAYTSQAMIENATALLLSLGPPLLAASIGGGIAIVIAPRSRLVDSVGICAAALAASVWVFQSIVPAATQDRYLEPMLPPLLILAGTALRWLAGTVQLHLTPLVPRSAPALAGCVVAIGTIASVAPGAAVPTAKLELGYIRAAPEVWRAVSRRNPVVLVVAGTGTEGAAVAEIALNDPQRPSLFAIRGSRLLGAGGYNSFEYIPRFHTAAEVMAAVDDYHIPLVLFRMDGNQSEWAHVGQVADAVKLYPDRWEPIYRFDRSGVPVILYRVLGNDGYDADFRRVSNLSAPRTLVTRQ